MLKSACIESSNLNEKLKFQSEKTFYRALKHFKIKNQACSKDDKMVDIGVFKNIRIYPNKIDRGLKELKNKDIEYLLELLSRDIY